jgi:hypothetical protein
MSFPQPNADQAAINGQQYFRLNTLISSMGDLYESAQGSLAVALGPNSDIANVRVSYWDDTVPGGVNTIMLSPDRSFIGRVDARNETTYIKSNGRPGRILIGIDDIFNTTFRPEALFNGIADGRNFNPAKDVITFVQPVLDVIQYFQNPPSLIPQRSDKTFRFQYLPVAPDAGNGGVSILAIPMYGRKSGYLSVKNLDNGINFVGVQVGAARLSTSTNPPAAAPDGSVNGVLSPWIGVGAGFSTILNFKSSTMGLWDLLLIELGGGVGVNPPFGYHGGPMPITLTLSDDPL